MIHSLPTPVNWTLVLWVQEPKRRQGNWRNRRIIQRQFVELLFYGQSPATRAKSTTAKAKIANSPVIAKTSSKCPNSASFRRQTYD